jgi:hypothetical protein
MFNEHQPKFTKYQGTPNLLFIRKLVGRPRKISVQTLSMPAEILSRFEPISLHDKENDENNTFEEPPYLDKII